MGSIWSPPAISGDVGIYSPPSTASSTVRQDLTAAASIDGISNGVTRRTITIVNISDTYTLTFNNENTTIPGAQLILPSSSNLACPPDNQVSFWYDDSSSGWRVQAVSSSGSSGGTVPSSRNINTTAPLAGGGNLGADLTLSVSQFTSGASGVVPASGGGSTNYLRADGTWDNPSSSGVPSSRNINTTAPLTGGGNLSADLTLAVSQFTSSTSGIVSSSGGGSSNFLRADNTWDVPPGTGVPTTRNVNTTTPLAGGGALSADLTLTVSQFTSSTAGTVSGSGGGTVNFLRADGTWQAPPGTGGVPTSRNINTTSPLTGGGNLSADLTLAINTFSSGASGVVPASGGGTTKFLRADGTWDVPNDGYDPDFGTGTDGSLTFNGTSTVLGLVPSSSTYTMTRSIYASSMTINTGVTIKSAGYQIFVNGTLTNNGTISNNGVSGVSTGAGTGAPAGYYPSSSNGGASDTAGSGGGSGGLPAPWGATDSSNNGGAGGTTPNGAGSAGTTPSVAFRGGGGGGGGANSGTTGDVGHAGGTITVSTSKLGPLSLLMDNGGIYFVPSFTAMTCGSGGGGGGSWAGAGSGVAGGGGGGAGICYVAAQTISGTGSITSNGGNGGNGTSGGSSTGGAGGGGGGGGYIVWVKYSTMPGTQTITANGGTGGSGGTSTSNGAGASGGAGSNGYAFKINLSGDGT
jgi:hypothetical protein